MTGQAVSTERVSVNSIAMSQTSGGGALSPQNLGDVVRFAEVMSKADIAIPPHLRGNAGACLAVTMQAMRWEMDPFACASKTYLVNKTIAYEAQLIAAVINTRAGLKRRLAITYVGDGDRRKCIVTGEFLDGSVQVYESPEFGRITPKNSPLWKSDPDQQQSYFSVRSFGRRFCPEVILGVYDRDEIAGAVEMKTVSPDATSSIAARLAASRGTQTADGGTQILDHVNREMAAGRARDAADDDFNDDITETEPEGHAGYNDGEPSVGGEAGNGPEEKSLSPEQIDALERFAKALFRAESKVGLKTYSATFWNENGGMPIEGEAMHGFAGRIYRAHLARVEGVADVEGTHAAVNQIMMEA